MTAGFVIVLDDDIPARLIPPQSDKLKPEVNENWELTGFECAFFSPFSAVSTIPYSRESS